MKLSERLYTAVQDIWPDYLNHPFVVQMADGSLPLEKFRYYMLQDYVYLRDYIKIFAACLEKTDDFQLVRFFSDNIAAVLDETERVHVPYMKRLGITNEEISAVEPHIDNCSYTHYMYTEAQTGNVLSGLTALLNCSWTYDYISENMVKKYPDAPLHENYGQWFAGYISPEYKQTNTDLINMVDHLSADVSDKDAEKLIQIFKKCSEYEMHFWNMAYSMGK